jgi:hypothetical protein
VRRRILFSGDRGGGGIIFSHAGFDEAPGRLDRARALLRLFRPAAQAVSAAATQRRRRPDQRAGPLQSAQEWPPESIRLLARQAGHLLAIPYGDPFFPS